MNRDRLLRAVAVPSLPAETRAQLHYQLAVSYDTDAELGGDEAYAKARGHYAEALKAAPDDSPNRFDIAFGYAQCVVRDRRRSLDDLRQARAALREAIDRFGQQNELMSAFAMGVLAEIDLALPGDRASKVEKVIAGLDSARAVLEQHRERVAGRDMAIFLARFGRALEMRLYGDREANTNAAVATYLRAAEACGPEEDLAEHAAALRDAATLAIRSTEIGTVREGLSILDELDTRIGPNRSPLELARDLATRGGLRLRAFDLHGEQEDLAAAEAHLRAAIAITDTARDRSLRAGLLTNLGGILIRRTVAPEDAEDLLLDAVSAADAVASARAARISARYHLGRFLCNAGRTRHAGSVLRQALSELEADVAPDDTEPAVVELAREASPPIEALIDTLLWPVEPGELDRNQTAISAALNALERNKCRALGVSIAAERTARPATVSPSRWEEYLRAVRNRRRLTVETMMGRIGRERRPWISHLPRAGEPTTHSLDLAELELMIRDNDLTQAVAYEAAHRRQIELKAPGTDIRSAWPENSAAQAAQLAHKGNAIVHFVTTEHATYTITTTARGTRVNCAPTLGSRALHSLLDEAWFGPYDRYRHAVEQAAPVAIELLESWRNAVASIGAVLSRHLGLGALWQALAAEAISQVIFIPYRTLHLVPLHLLEDERGNPLCDRFAISYAPSLAIYAAGGHQGGPCAERGLFIQDPDETLSFAALDVLLTQAFVKVPTVLSGAACRAEKFVAAVSGADLLHFCGHAFLDVDEPLRSALRLADRDVSMAEIAARVDLSTCRIALLSACETARTSPTVRGDEYSGLPGAFLRAGAHTVVGTLWAVDDAACAFFDQAFCRSMLESGQAPTIAFAEAVRRLRALTHRDLPALLEADEVARLPSAKRLLLRAKITPDPDQSLFDHPVYWAPFCVIGGRAGGTA